MTLFLVSLGFGIVIPIMPFYALNFGASPFELGLLIASFSLVNLIAIVIITFRATTTI